MLMKATTLSAWILGSMAVSTSVTAAAAVEGVKSNLRGNKVTQVNSADRSGVADDRKLFRDEYHWGYWTEEGSGNVYYKGGFLNGDAPDGWTRLSWNRRDGPPAVDATWVEGNWNDKDGSPDDWESFDSEDWDDDWDWDASADWGSWSWDGPGPDDRKL